MKTQRRMLILAEGKFGPVTSKTANGAIAFLHDQIVAVVDSRNVGATVQDVLGYGGSIPVVKDLQAGLAYGPDTLLIGIAPPGGNLPVSWRPHVIAALHSKLNVLAGLHTYLSDDPEFSSLAAANDCTIVALR